MEGFRTRSMSIMSGMHVDLISVKGRGISADEFGRNARSARSEGFMWSLRTVVSWPMLHPPLE